MLRISKKLWMKCSVWYVLFCWYCNCFQFSWTAEFELYICSVSYISCYGSCHNFILG